MNLKSRKMCVYTHIKVHGTVNKPVLVYMSKLIMTMNLDSINLPEYRPNWLFKECAKTIHLVDQHLHSAVHKNACHFVNRYASVAKKKKKIRNKNVFSCSSEYFRNLIYQCAKLALGRSKTFWKKIIAYFPLIRHEPQRKWRLQKFDAAEKSLPSCYLATIGVYIDRPTDTRVQQFFYCCVYSLPRECV
jgi:hypothetical protein